MKLREGLSIVIGRKTYRNEIPDDKFAVITRDWPELKVDEFIRNYCVEIPVAKKRKKEKQDE